MSAAVTIAMGREGVPERFTWDGDEYEVTDTPTALDLDYATITHPPAVPVGWRFQGTGRSGRTRMFDVMHDPARGEWLLLHTYE